MTNAVARSRLMEIDIRQRSASNSSEPQIPQQNTAFVHVHQIAKSIGNSKEETKVGTKMPPGQETTGEFIVGRCDTEDQQFIQK